jgi:membrane-anchored mycosin MYCP
MIRITATRRRVLATGVSALLVLLGPAAAPAWADVSMVGSGGSTGTAASQVGPEYWTPPPIDYNAYLPPNVGPNGLPDHPYTPGQQGCIASGVGNVPLQNEPAAQAMLDVTSAQKIGHYGTGVTVAEIDTGVNPHPFLTGNGRLIPGGDYILGKNALNDCDGHGTIVAGIIGANTTNSGVPVAFTGMAPQANILAIKQTSSNYQFQNGNTTVNAGDLTTLAEAIYYAASRPDVKVITMSVDECVPATPANLAFIYQTTPFRQLQAAIHYAMNVADKVVIAAAGNIATTSGNGTDQNGQVNQSACSNVPNNTNPNPNQVNMIEIPPVFANDLLSVASVSPVQGAQATSGVSTFSVWGPWVSVAAPGEGIISVDPGPGATGLSNQTFENGNRISLQGTSFAAPYVAGLAALIRAKYPSMSARQVMQLIEATAQHPSGGVNGRNSAIGYGVIDPMAALTSAVPGLNGIPPQNAINIRAQLPHSAVQDWVPLRVALIGAAAGVVVFLVTAFIIRTRRRDREHEIVG